MLGPLRLLYQLPRLVSSVSYRNPFKELALSGGRKIAAERYSMGEQHDLNPEDAASFGRLILAADADPTGGPDPATTRGSPALLRVLTLEQIQRGLQAYL